MRPPWWTGLDLRVLRHVRGVLRRRGLELTLVERRPTESTAAFAPLSTETAAGAGLAVIAPELSAPELALVEAMLREAALDVSTALADRGAPPPPSGRRTSYHGIFGAASSMQELYDLLERIAPSESTVLIQGENGRASCRERV